MVGMQQASPQMNCSTTAVVLLPAELELSKFKKHDLHTIW